jgi:hypothetical protein
LINRLKIQMHKTYPYARITIIILSAVFFTFFTQISQAQTKLTGRIYEYKTHIRLAGIRVENLKTHTSMTSDTSGRFSINAAIGDKISYTGMSYKTDTIYLADLKFKEIYLELNNGNLLKEVKVVDKEVNLGSLAVPIATGPFGSNTVRYQTDANGNNSGGVKIGLPGFNGDQKKKERDAQKAADEQTELKIDKIFSVQNLENYLPIRGQELINFTILYRPSISVYQDKFNLTIYVDSCYQEFLKIPKEQRKAKDFLDINRKQ